MDLLEKITPELHSNVNKFIAMIKMYTFSII